MLKTRVEDGVRLGLWVVNKRKQYGNGRLATERIASLEALPDWTWDTRDADWDGALVPRDFRRRESHTRVPQHHREDGYPIGKWISHQRVARRLGRISSERVARLEGLPGWTWGPQEADWEEAFSRLARFVEREGSARVPNDHVEDGFGLGSWTGNQRSANRKHRLSAERIARLEALPDWTWAPHDAAWEEGFSYLGRFVARESHARVPLAHLEDGYPVGKWISHQRGLYGAGSLSPDRIARLEALPGWTWDVKDAAWERGFSSLQHFVERVGHPRVPREHIEGGFALGAWCHRTGVATTGDGPIRRERAARLEALPGWTWGARKRH